MVRVLHGPADRFVIDRFNLPGPSPQHLILRKLLLELMDIAQEMDPTPLVQPLMDVVTRVEIAAQDSLEVVPDQVFDHLSTPGMVVFIIAESWGRKAPDVSVQAIFSPARLIRLHGWTRADLRLESIEQGLGIGSQTVENLNDLSHADLHSV